MQKTLSKVAYGAVVIILVLFTGYYASNHSIGQTDMTYPYGQTDMDKAEALKVVFNDAMINHSVAQAGRYTANVTVGGAFDDSGYAGLDGRLARVDMSTVSFTPQTFQVLADISNGREMEARYSYSILSKHDFVLLPHGVTWYRSFMANNSTVSIYMEFDPQTAMLRPVIVDGANFEKYMGGQPFEPLSYMDVPAGEIKAYSGSNPVSSLWNTSVTLPGVVSPQKCYFIIKNNDQSRDMMVRLEFKTG
ncbi:MAG TPA: hypothetical protein VMC84_13430 [Methanocella sp.]|uniref:hypothetical protein n=1 Tax=Methanocella sp. TaxID=2052833 RepID=UPI002BFA4489|nr:hypothetical protein [Methanocella sp.]HTY92171.1 hypothetical protein [Methanocella sp.]